VTCGSVTVMGSTDSLLRSEVERVKLVGNGLSDMVVVAMGDVILIADRSRVQEVKDAVARLKARAARQAEAFAHAPESDRAAATAPFAIAAE
jgi:mannose-1-phosphate guanylyltransferase / mannose-6-phosphate isomerase